MMVPGISVLLTGLVLFISIAVNAECDPHAAASKLEVCRSHYDTIKTEKERATCDKRRETQICFEEVKKLCDSMGDKVDPSLKDTNQILKKYCGDCEIIRPSFVVLCLVLLVNAMSILA